jgi:hypothetical protein
MNHAHGLISLAKILLEQCVVVLQVAFTILSVKCCKVACFVSADVTIQFITGTEVLALVLVFEGVAQSVHVLYAYHNLQVHTKDILELFTYRSKPALSSLVAVDRCDFSVVAAIKLVRR